MRVDLSYLFYQIVPQRNSFIFIVFVIFSKNGFFVDLFVRVSNVVAISMYKSLGYVVYREILDYYSGSEEENAYGTLHLNVFIYLVN